MNGDNRHMFPNHGPAKMAAHSMQTESEKPPKGKCPPPAPTSGLPSLAVQSGIARAEPMLQDSFPPSSSIPVQTQPSSSSLTPGPLLVGPRNCETVCPFCHACVKTSVRYTTTTRTHELALHCCFSCCCCIPYCMDSARNSDHYCPKCKKYLGTYKK